MVGGEYCSTGCGRQTPAQSRYLRILVRIMIGHNRHSESNRAHQSRLGSAFGKRPGMLLTALLMIWVTVSMIPAAVAQNSIKLAWDPNPESSLSGYKVHYGATSRVYAASIDVGNVTNYALNVPQAGTYYIAVTAYDNLQNQSGYSNEVSTTIGSCAYLISPTGRTHGLGAESGTINVSAGVACSWTATSNVSWISIASGAAGAGIGAVSYSVQAWSNSTSRTGTIAVAGQTFLVTQGSPGFCDVNRDGQITSDDLQLLVYIVLGKSICPSNCDLNHDARLDVADLQTLANVIIGVNTCR